MEHSDQSEDFQLLKFGEEGASRQTERNEDGDAEKISATVTCNTSKVEMMRSRPMNICELSATAYALFHKCLDDGTGGQSRQLIDDNWVCYGFKDRETVGSAIEYLVTNKRIAVVNGEYAMKYVPKTSSVSSKKLQESYGKEELDSSSQSASKIKYPFSHVHRYLKVKDESRRAPSRREAEAMSMSECCDWI